MEARPLFNFLRDQRIIANDRQVEFLLQEVERSQKSPEQVMIDCGMITEIKLTALLSKHLPAAEPTEEHTEEVVAPKITSEKNLRAIVYFLAKEDEVLVKQDGQYSFQRATTVSSDAELITGLEKASFSEFIAPYIPMGGIIRGSRISELLSMGGIFERTANMITENELGTRAA